MNTPTKSRGVAGAGAAARAARARLFLPLPRLYGWGLTAGLLLTLLLALLLAGLEPKEMYLQLWFVMATVAFGLLRRVHWEYILQQALFGFGIINLACSWNWRLMDYPPEPLVYESVVALVALQWRTLTRRNWVGALLGFAIVGGLIVWSAHNRVYAGPATVAMLAVFCFVYGLFFIEVTGEGSEEDPALEW